MRQVESHSRQISVSVLPWRLVAGVFLHFALPIYLVALVTDALLSAPHDATAEMVLDHALRFSGWFLVAYLLVAVLATAGAAAIDPALRMRRARRATSSPLANQHMSQARLVEALSQGTGKFGADADVYLAAIRATRWDHEDHRFQLMANDLHDVVSTALVALTEALPDRRPSLNRMTCASLARIETALGELVIERRRRVDGDVEAVFRYIEVRHGGSDFSGSSD